MANRPPGRRGPRIVAFGGGTGMSTLLYGLKKHSDNITAIVTVSDDGGSSGRLRQDYDIPPPGDIRNCLIALCDAGDLIEQLFQYRFEETDLKGHSFGNLFLTALTKVTGDFPSAIREANQILNVRGQVLPAAPEKVAIIAHHADGTKSTGERQISQSHSKIEKITLRPEQGPISKDIRDAVETAELFLFGPGSLYTSVIPTLLNPELQSLLSNSNACALYICNVMTQPGETTNFTAADHLKAIEDHIGTDIIDGIVVNTGSLPEPLRERYAQNQAGPVLYDPAQFNGRIQTIAVDLSSNHDYARHDSHRLADAVLTTLAQRRPMDGE